MRKTLSLLLAICFFIAPVFSQSNDTLPSETGIVYFYRVEEVNALDSRRVTVKVEGRDFLKMSESRFIGFRFTPGRYGLRMRQRQSEMLLTVEAGRRYFVRVSQTVAGFGFNQSLTLMPEEQAIYQMRDMRPLDDRNILDRSREIIRERPTNP